MRLSSFLVASKTLTPLKTLTLNPLLRNPNPVPASSTILLHGFSSTPSSDPPPAAAAAAADAAATADAAAPTADPAAGAAQKPEPARRTTRSERRNSERLDETICYMMARRPWTTRLQNSIRTLSPSFDEPLVLAVLRGAHHPDHALRFFRWVEKSGFRHTPGTYRSIISLLARHSMLNHARCILIDDMPKRGVAPDESMFAALIEGYGHAGIPQEVVKLFQRMPEFGVDRTVVSYNAFFKAILRRGRVMMAKRIFNKMTAEGVAPALSTYNILIWGFCLSLKMETANRFFADMKGKGIAPDVVSYNTLLNGWVRSKRMGDAEKLFDEMSRAGFAPNSVSYNIMIKGYVCDGKVDDGMRIFGEMSAKKLQPDERTYEALLPGLSDEPGRNAEALKLLTEMAEHKFRPKDKSVFLRLISRMCESGDLDAALEVRKVMDQLHVRVESSHYGVLIEGMCKAGNYDKAVEVLDELLEKGALVHPRSAELESSSYNPIIKYLCDHGFTKKAEAFFRQLMKKGVDDKIAFNHLIRGHTKEGAAESAFELVGIMTRRGVKSDVDVYALLVESYLKKGEPTEARTALDSMMEQGHLPSASLFESVMVALFDDGRVQTASRVMKSMIERGVKENTDMVHKIIVALFTRGHVEEALGRINLMLMNDYAPDFDSLIGALCDDNKVIEAHKLVDFGVERDCNISFSNYDRVLDLLSSAGETLLAYSLLCKIKTKGGVVDKKGSEALINSLIAEGNTKQADILSRILAGKAPLETKRGSKVSAYAC